mmetsp:Transcript_38560/g.75263  ORF Transcript_38560/g.75263 Transcript_38560/m.75263 type:complete len:271 (-) Transcript_38560:28-840(-)
MTSAVPRRPPAVLLPVVVLRDHVHDPQPVRIRRLPRVQQLLAQDLRPAPRSVEQRHPAVCRRIAEDRVQRLDHRGDPRAPREHGDVPLREGGLDLDVGRDVFEAERVAGRHAAQVSRHLAVRVRLDQQIEGPGLLVRADGGVGPHDLLLRRSGRGRRRGPRQETGARAEAQSPRGVREPEGVDGGRGRHVVASEEGSGREPFGAELARARGGEGADGRAGEGRRYARKFPLFDQGGGHIEDPAEKRRHQFSVLDLCLLLYCLIGKFEIFY